MTQLTDQNITEARANSVIILADSLNVETGDRLTTFLLNRFPKCLLAELNTHRAMSRNAASSRALPISKVIEQAQKDPFIPQWTGHQKGMTGRDDVSDLDKHLATVQWLAARDNAVASAERILSYGLAKQNVNRLLEPFMFVPVVISATEWENFFRLRCAPDAQPEFRSISLQMRRLQALRSPDKLAIGQWHIPFTSDDLSDEDRLQVATARAARCSYANFDGSFDIQADKKLCDRLIAENHMSPLEHSAYADIAGKYRNYLGFRQYRQLVEESV